MGTGYNYSYVRRANYLGSDRPELNKRYDYECHLNSSTKYYKVFINIIIIHLPVIFNYPTIMYSTNKIKMSDRVQSYKPLSNQQSQPLRPTRFFDSRPGMWTVTVVLLVNAA